MTTGIIRLSTYVTPEDPLVERMALLLTPQQAYIYIRDRIKYHSEKDDYWKTPRQTLLDGWGDCDDKSFLMHSYLLARGIPSYTYFVYLPTKRTGHAYNYAFINGKWIPIDTTCVDCKFGQKPKIKEIVVARFDGVELEVFNKELWDLITSSYKQSLQSKSGVTHIIIE